MTETATTAQPLLFVSRNRNKYDSRMAPTRFLTTTKLLALMGLTSVSGYTVTVDHRPFAQPLGPAPTEFQKNAGLIRTKQPNNDNGASIGKRKMRTTMYDLGLGKNQPVIAGTKQHPVPHTTPTTTMAEAVQFLVEHNAVCEYPAPGGPDDTTTNHNQGRRRPSVPVVRLERTAEDVLKIRDHPDGSSAPRITTRSGSAGEVQLDVNTAWVEMLIHSEQAKLI